MPLTGGVLESKSVGEEKERIAASDRRLIP